MIDNKPLISVILPVYNSEKYILQSLNSLKQQTFKNFEIIIVNDCSTDKSLEIIRSLFPKQSKDNVRIISNKKNLGITKSLNKAFNLSKSKYIARMDSDDISEKKRLERQLDFLESNKEISLCGTNVNLIDEKNKVFGKTNYPTSHFDIKTMLFFQNTFCHSTIFFKKNIFSKSPYDTSFETTQDYELFSRLIKNHKLANLKDCLGKLRIHSKSASKLKRNIQLKNSIRVQRKYFLTYFLDSKFNKKIFEDLNNFFLSDKNAFKNKEDIPLLCIKIMKIFLKINSKFKNKNLDFFFLKRFLTFFYFSITEKSSLIFLKKIIKIFGFFQIFKSLICLVLNRLVKTIY